MPSSGFSAKRLLIVHAHPDDESLFTAHLIADSLANGVAVQVLTLTRGERGKLRHAELAPIATNHLSVGHYRVAELRRALAAYGSELRHKFVGTRAYLDSGARPGRFGRLLPARPLDDLSLCAAGVHTVSDDLLAEIRDFKPDAVVTYSGRDSHPDHVMTHRATAAALRRYAKARRGRAPQFWVIAAPDEPAEVSVGGEATAPIKRAALQEYSSQISTDADSYSYRDGEQIGFAVPEGFRRAQPSPLVLLGAIRTGLWAAPLGVLLAVAGTLLHQIHLQNPFSAGTVFPIGLVLALLSVGSLMLALRLLRSSRGALYLAAATFAATVFALAQAQPGGEVLVPANQAGYFWSFGSIALTALIMIFPRISRAAWRV